MAFCGLYLRSGSFDLLLLSDTLKSFEMRLGCLILAAGLRISDLRVIHQLASQRAFAQQLLAIIEKLLRCVNRLLGSLHIGLGLSGRLGDDGAGGGAVVRFRLIELPLAFGGGGSEVAAFEFGYQLSLRDMVAAVDVELPHRSADLRHHVGPVAREEHGVRGNDAADGVLPRRRDLHRHNGLSLLFFLLRTSGHQQQ